VTWVAWRRVAGSRQWVEIGAGSTWSEAVDLLLDHIRHASDSGESVVLPHGRHPAEKNAQRGHRRAIPPQAGLWDGSKGRGSERR